MGRISSAGLLLALLAPPAGAQAAHRYVNVAVTTLPEPGDPVATVFVDVASASRAGDVVDLDVIYALGEAKTINGRDTIYALFKYEVACTAKTLKLPRYEIHGPDGAVQPSDSKDPAHPAATQTDEAILGLACGAKPAASGYAELNDVLLHAADFVRTQREQDPKLKHAFVLTGAANRTKLGAFNLYIDTATLARSGDQVTAQSLQVFQQAIDPAVQPGAYVINTVTFDCTAKTSRTPFVVLYRADGTPLQTGLTGNPAKTVPPNTVSEKMLNLACGGVDPGYHVAPYASLSETLTAAWRSLSAKSRE